MKIDFFPHQSHCYAFGGWEITMFDVAGAVRSEGGDIRFRDWWSCDERAPIVHHWGLGYAHWDNIRWAKSYGQKIVSTVLFNDYDTIGSRVRHILAKRVGQSRIICDSIRDLNIVVVFNELQARVAIDHFGADPEKVRIIYAMVPDAFVPENSFQGAEEYWVCAGTICSRKNQLRTAIAAERARVKLKIIGNPLAIEADYAEALRVFVSTARYVEWIPAMERASKQYFTMLAGCKGLIFTSFQEQGPIIAMELAALGKQVILADRDYARQKIFSSALRVDPKSIDQIAALLKRADVNSDLGKGANGLERHRPQFVGNSYLEIYKSLSK